jgi:uncharacterized membrane protein YcaP (DUF421 family)
MWTMDNPWWETMLRAFVIYAGLYLLFRFLGKKQQGQMSAFDLILLLIISEAVSNGLTGGDQSLPTALICAGTLMLLSYLIDYASFKSKIFEKLLEGEPQLIINNGVVNKKVQNAAHISNDELAEILRDHGVDHIEMVKVAVLETNGKVSVIKKDSSP